MWWLTHIIVNQVKNMSFSQKLSQNKKIQKVTQNKLCSAKRPHIEQPPGQVRFHSAWYQTMMGGGPAHALCAISQFKGVARQESSACEVRSG